MSSIEQSILDSIEILLNKRVSQLQFDKTVRATIVSVQDQSIGKYKVRYQDSLFYAYADPDSNYNEDDQVYVQIPSSDYNKTKLIVGSVSDLGTKYLQAVTPQGKMTRIGSNVFTNNNSVSFCSYNGKQTNNLLNDQIFVDGTALNTYKSNAKYFLIGMNVRTALPAQQQISGGNYGIIIQANYYSTAYKSKAVQTAEDLITKTYVLDVNNMLGQPYKYTVANRQYSIFAIDGDNLASIKSIQAFCEGFPMTKANQANDIFLSNFQLYFMEELTSDELSNASLKILTPNGSYFTSANDDTKYLAAELKIKGKSVNYDAQKVDFYWFIRDTTITASNSLYYSQYAGEGWRCLNQYSTYNGRTQFIAESYQKHISFSMAPAKINTFKCVAVYDDTTLSATIKILNNVSKNNIAITSSAGTQFYFDTGRTTLTCQVTGVSGNLTYNWGYRTGSEALTEVENHSKAITIQISEATEIITYECTVYNGSTYIGSAEITLTNGVPENEYSLIINNGTQVFKYDEYGISTASPKTSPQNKITIPTLSFDIYNDQGQLVTPTDDREKVKMCDIKWIWPSDDDYTMLKTSATLTNDTIINPTTNSKILRRIIANTATLAFTIDDNFDLTKIDNNIKLQINFQGHHLVTSTNFTFVKDGQQGTNGTQYISRLVPFDDKYERIYFENGSLYGYYRTISQNYNTNTGQTKNIETFKFDKINRKDALRAQLWGNASHVLYDSQSSSNSISPSLTWNMIDVGAAKLHNATVSAQGALTYVGIDNTSTIVESTINTNELSQLAKNYYAAYPIDIVVTNTSTMHMIVTGGFRECMYQNDGTRSRFNKSKPFTLRIFNNGSEIALNNNDITWHVSWYTDKKNIALQGQNKVSIDPPAYYNSETINNYIIATYGNYKIILSIYFYLNRYGLSAMNDWDGTSIKINREGTQYILAPQIGAGQKDSDNAFTGITMGKTFGVNGSSTSSERGLMGFYKGARSIFLDAKTGRAIFGIAGKSQINISPQKYGAAPAGSIYSWNYYDFDSSGRPSRQRNQGMLIDLDEPSIKFGSGNFIVDASGHITAKGGGTIAGWNISDTTLKSGNIILDSGNNEINVNKKFIVHNDGSFEAANGKFSVTKDGVITSTEGTIGGWTITRNTLSGGNTQLNSNGTINCSNLIARNSGNIGGWAIGSNSLSGGGTILNSNGTITCNRLIANVGGTIGGWTIGSGFLKSGDLVLDALKGILSGKLWSFGNDGYNLKAAGNETTMIGGFVVTPDGLATPDGKTLVLQSNAGIGVGDQHVLKPDSLALLGKACHWETITITDASGKSNSYTVLAS